MKTSPVTPADLAGSVLAVPPLARVRNGSVSIAENRKIVDWLAAGGVTTLMYGGNANFYNLGILEYPLVLELLTNLAAADTWVIPSIGPDFGKALDQVAILKSFDFPTAMALPMASATRPAGVATGLRRLAEAYGKPVIAYVRAENYFTPADIASLISDGVVSAVKYAVERKDPSEDGYLAAIVGACGPDRIVSGIGERPAIVHLRDFGLSAFTSGSVCVAPRSSMHLLQLLTDKKYDEAEQERAAFIPLEDCRDEYSPIRVLHEAVTLADIADMGPMLPMLSNLPAAHHERVASAARVLRQHDQRHAIA